MLKYNKILEMSNNQYLENLASRLVLSEEEKVSIKCSITNLQKHLQNWEHHISIKNHYCFGSFSRDTLLPRAVDPNSDIDYMIEFDDNNRTQPQTYLNWLKDFAYTYYSRSDIHQDFPTIALELNHIRFELVPAVTPWGTLDLQIPAPKSLFFINWISTNPEQLRKDELNCNRQTGYKLKQVIRLLKCWNVRQGKVISSYELERCLTSMCFWGCLTLEDYFYYAASNLYVTGLSSDKQRKLEYLRNSIKQIKNYKKLGYNSEAERLLCNLVNY